LQSKQNHETQPNHAEVSFEGTFEVGAKAFVPDQETHDDSPRANIKSPCFNDVPVTLDASLSDDDCDPSTLQLRG